jgi:hypothetical protein
MMDSSIIITISGGAIALLGLIYRVYADNSRRIQAVSDEREKSVAGVYRRFDEHKAHVDASYVRKGACDIIHSQSKREFDELKRAMEKGFEDLREDFKTYNQTMIALIGQIVEKGK